MKFLDISLPISERTVSWRGSFPVEVTWHSRTASGDRTTNSSWRLHAHTGTHLDAPLHHVPDGRPVDELDLADFLGPCRVLDLEGVSGDIGPAELAGAEPSAGQRLLLRTDNSRNRLLTRPDFPADYTGLSVAGARLLAEAGVRLVGTDFLSVEPVGANRAPTHRVLLEAGIAILEGLVLTDVPEGEYTLLFLPLPLAGADAAPGRALLLPDGYSPPH